MTIARTAYQKAKDGRHPDIQDPSRLSRKRRVRLATTLAIRDRFDPLCMELASLVRDMDHKQILGQPLGLREIERKAPNSSYSSELKEVHRHGISFGEFGDNFYSRPLLLNRAYMLGRFYAQPSIKNARSLGVSVNSPVTVYGESFALNLLHTSALMMVITERFLGKGLDKIAKDDDDLGASLQRDTRAAFHEGVISIGHAFALFMAEPVFGISTPPLQCMQTIASASLPNLLSQIVPNKFMASLLTFSRFPRDLVTVDESGVPHINPDFTRRISEYRRENRIRDGCPVGKRMSGASETGITALVEAYLHTYTAVDSAAFDAERYRVA